MSAGLKLLYNAGSLFLIAGGNWSTRNEITTDFPQVFDKLLQNVVHLVLEGNTSHQCRGEETLIV